MVFHENPAKLHAGTLPDHAQYTKVIYPTPFDPPFVPDDIPVGISPRGDTCHANGLRRILTFEGVDSCFYLYVNGEFAGYSQVSHHTSEFDITDLLREGENSITAPALSSGRLETSAATARISVLARSISIPLTTPA